MNAIRILDHHLNWVYIEARLRSNPNDMSALLAVLRGDEDLSSEGRRFIANLFDPDKPLGLHAKVVAPKGRKSNSSTEFMIYTSYCAWRKKNPNKRGMSEVDWEQIAENFKIEDIRTVKQAVNKARLRLKKWTPR